MSVITWKCSDESSLTPFLPNEIIIEIIKLSTEKDRQCIGAVNKHLRALDRKAGHRHFTRVTFHLERFPIFEAVACDIRYRLDRETPDHEIIDFFRHSTTDELIVEGRVDVDDVLRAASSTLKFKNLTATYFGDYSGGLISHLVRNRAGIENIDICWTNLRTMTRPAKQMLLSLPSVKNCTIIQEACFDELSCLIDDDIFLHLIENVSCSIRLDSKKTAITAIGLHAAFQKIINVQHQQEVRFAANEDEFRKIFDKYKRDGRFHHEQSSSGECLRHRDTNAIITRLSAASQLNGCFWSGKR